MLTLLLIPVLSATGVLVTGYGIWQGFISVTDNDACLGGFLGGNFLSSTNCTPDIAARFVNVVVPVNATVTRARFYSNCYDASLPPAPNVTVENVTDSHPFTTVSEVLARPWILQSPCTWLACDIIPHIQRIISMASWIPGNSIALKIASSTPSYVCNMDSLEMEIQSRVQGTMDLLSSFNVVPITGNWSSDLNAASFTNLSVGILDMRIANSFSSSFAAVELNVTNGFISNGQYTFNCLSIQLSGSGDKRNVTCKLPCAPGSGYVLTVAFCLSIRSPEGFNVEWIPDPFCFNVNGNGIINFPSPVLLPGTLLPDLRPYLAGAGQLDANVSSQVIRNRAEFTATLGVQHFCVPDSRRWATFRFGGSAIACVGASRTPLFAVDDYSTLSCSIDSCSESMCPEGVPMVVTIQYLNDSLATVDSLVYPTFPQISAVSGCENSLRTTRNCPSSGGVWLNITMSQSSGFIEVSVKVGDSPCTNVSVISSNIFCLLPAGVGSSRPVTVISGGYSSSPLYISYGAPTIRKLEGGAGCVPDDSFTNSTGLGADNNDISPGSTFAAAVTMCDRNGSDSVPLTIIGDNFGDSSVPVTLKLRGATIDVVKDQSDPHRKLYVKLPPGPGSGARLALTAMVELQSVSALVSYEPCPQGQDANCLACDVGRYGLETPVCEPCLKGRYQPRPGQASCELCPKGTYQPALGQARCIPCLDQMTTFGVGSESNEACTPCPLTHYFDSNSTECIRCAPNSIPHGSGCGCVSGFFDDRKTIDEADSGASLKCVPCPAGANCQAIGTRFATMSPFAGWWRSGFGTFAQCLQAVNCVGMPWNAFSAENASQMCVSHRRGVLCAECEQGYQSRSLQGGVCVPCESSSWAWVWASLVIILLSIVLLGVGFYGYRRWQIRKLRTEKDSAHFLSSESSSSTSTSAPSSRAPSSSSSAPPPTTSSSVSSNVQPRPTGSHDYEAPQASLSPSSPRKKDQRT